jgi:hypothetical protein
MGRPQWLAVCLFAPLIGCDAILGDFASGSLDAGVEAAARVDASHGDATVHRADSGHSDATIADDAQGDAHVSIDAGCAAGEMSCNNNCSDTTSDPKNCGGCGNDCTLAAHVDPLTTRCASGQCVYACLPGFGECGGDAGVGCTTNVATATNCGFCGHVCSGMTPLCAASTVDGGAPGCVSGCPAGTTLCGSSCVYDQTDPIACGALCTVCSFLCMTGTCTGECYPNTMGCTGPNNATPETCDASGTWVQGSVTAHVCGTVCTPGDTGCSDPYMESCNSIGQWVMGMVEPPLCGAACVPGATQCTGTPATFQETCNPNGQWGAGVLSPQCGAMCSPGQTECVGSTQQAVCDSSGMWGTATNCTGTNSACCTNSCTNLDTDNNNCGACGMPCSQPTSPTCSGGVCGCPPPQALCRFYDSGPPTCQSLNTHQNCGQCNHMCPYNCSDAGVCEEFDF